MRDACRPGETISHYRIDRKLGEGGMGVVYLAEDTKLARLVALKFLPETASDDLESRLRFLQEARSAAALNHPNICTVYEIDEDAGFLAIEYIDGETIEARRNHRPLPLAQAFDFALQAAAGLEAAHEKGVIHRDIKSANLMVTSKGQLKIMDFGLARLAGNARLTRTGSSLGTPAYMAPELFRGETADHRSDLWSLGVVLYEMVAGRLPFESETEAGLLYSVLNHTPDPLTSLRTGVPVALDRIVSKLLAKDRAQRYQHVEDFAVDLRALNKTHGPQPIEIPPPAPRRSRLAAGVFWAAAACLVVAGAAGWTWRERDRADREKAKQRVESLADAGAMIEAYRLAMLLEQRSPNDPDLPRLWETLGPAFPISTDPPGAEVQIRDYLKPDTEWLTIGRTPMTPGRLPFHFMSMRFRKDGYADVERAMRPVPLPPVKLIRPGEFPPGMVRVLGAGRPDQPTILDDFWLDRYETTNAEYKKFVDAGGYRDPKYWTQPFTDGVRTLRFEEAMARFQDTTGRPGPASWELGSFPEAAANLPVTGVSWYEAAAYAAFMDKQLPTVAHWRQAAIFQTISSEIIQLSNFAGKGPAAPGTYRGAGFFGNYDMAGNVKEWCWNASGEKRYVLGGAWNELSYMFVESDARSPFERRDTFGIRCARFDRPPAEAAMAPVTRQLRDYSIEKPASDDQFRVYQSLYAYERTPLNAKIEATDDSDPTFRRQTITFNAAYGEERMIAYLYLPAHAKPPYQTIVHFPGGYALFMDSIESVSLHAIRPFLQSGRAVLFPIYKGTYQRKPKVRPRGLGWRDIVVQMCKDLGRSVDYVETRPEIDRSRLAYQGTSLGAIAAFPCVALEPRLRTAILQGGGLPRVKSAADEIDPLHFAPRVRFPVLMMNGKDDFDVPLETSQVPMFRLLGSPAADKKHFVVEGGHVPPRHLLLKESLAWLDKYLGPVAGR